MVHNFLHQDKLLLNQLTQINLRYSMENLQVKQLNTQENQVMIYQDVQEVLLLLLMELLLKVQLRLLIQVVPRSMVLI